MQRGEGTWLGRLSGMNAARSRRTVFVGLGAAVLLAVGAWVAGAQIQSPAQVAAETAAPDPSAITVPSSGGCCRAR